MSNTIEDKLRKALKRDFNELLVKEFTTDWQIQRLKIGLDIEVMSFDNLLALITQQREEAELNAIGTIINRMHLDMRLKFNSRDQDFRTFDGMLSYMNGWLADERIRLTKDKEKL